MTSLAPVATPSGREARVPVSVRLEADLWNAVEQLSREHGVPARALIGEAVREYVASRQRDPHASVLAQLPRPRGRPSARALERDRAKLAQLRARPAQQGPTWSSATKTEPPSRTAVVPEALGATPAFVSPQVQTDTRSTDAVEEEGEMTKLSSEFWTASEVAGFLRVHRTTITRWGVPCIKIRKQRLYRQEEVYAWLREHARQVAV